MGSIKNISEKRTTEDPDLADRFNRVLGETVEAMEEAGLRYAFIGGIASGGLGRPRSTHDIDLFVVPEEAELATRALAKHGFKTEKTDPSWLYKAFKENILVDIIFKSKGEIYLDSEMYQKLILAEFHGRQLRLVAPEDLLIIKAAAHSELTPSHWHDAIALLSYANMDWRYLIKRARRAPRRILSLLLYAQSIDIWVPNYVVHELYSVIFENATKHGSPANSSVPLGQTSATVERLTGLHANFPKRPPHPKEGSGPSADQLQIVKNNAYAMAHLRERLAEDARTNEMDIQIEQQENRILLRGEVPLQERKDAVAEVAKELFPGYSIENQIRVSRYCDPGEVEEMK